jgi:protein arginine kinase activator
VQHEGRHHVGKVPAAAGAGVKRQHELMRLRRELSNAVETEDYEVAARLRDEISAMETSS